MTKRVLIVDDEIDTLNLLKTILEIHDFEPITTLNSVEAITLAEVEEPDVALLDIMMPELDGFTLCKMMREHDSLAELPVIFVTAYSALDLEDRRKQAGADFVLHKPIDIEKLVEMIETSETLRRKPDASNGTPPPKVEVPKPPPDPVEKKPDPFATPKPRPKPKVPPKPDQQ